MVRSTGRLAMTIAVDLGRKATEQTNKQKYCDLANNAILLFLSHHVGDKFSVPLIYYTCSHHVSY